MKKIIFDTNTNTIIKKAKKQEFITIKVGKNRYKIHPLIAYFLAHQQSRKKITNYPDDLRTFEDRPDCMVPKAGDRRRISVFSLCQNNTDSELMFQALLHVNNYTASETSIRFMRDDYRLKVDGNMALCAPLFAPMQNYSIMEQEIIIAREFLFKRKAPSASVLELMSSTNSFTLSLWATFASKKEPVLSNSEYLLPQDYLQNELAKDSMQFQRLSPVFKIMSLLLNDELLEDILTTDQIRQLIYLLYPPTAQSLIPSDLVQKITKYLFPKYHLEFINRAITQPHVNLLCDIDLSSRYLTEKQSIEIIIKSAINGVKPTKNIFKFVNMDLFYDVLNKRVEVDQAYDNFLLFTCLLEYVEGGLLSSDFFDRIHCLNKLSIETLDFIFLKIEQENNPSFTPVLHKGVRSLLEKNLHACNQYYLSGLRNLNHSNRVKWLHLYGFKVDLSFIELALKQKPVKGEQLIAFKRTLSSIKEEIKAYTSQGTYNQFIITPFDDQLENTLISMAERNQSQITSFLPNQSDLPPFDDCAFRLLCRLGIVKENQSLRRFCRQTRATNPAYAELSNTGVLKIKLTTLFETSSEERIMLCLLVKAEPMLCETLLHLYAWSIYDSQYQISVVNQIYDLLLVSLNQTAIERDCVAYSLTQGQQLTELKAQTSGLQTKMTEMTQLLQQQSQMLAQLLNQAPKPEDGSKHQSRFFGAK